MPRDLSRFGARQAAFAVFLTISVIVQNSAPAEETALSFAGVTRYTLYGKPMFSQAIRTPFDSTETLVYFDGASSTIESVAANGDGTFGAPRMLASAPMPNSMAVGDLNGDGRVDLVLAYRETSTIEVFLSRGGDSSYLPAEFRVNFYPEVVQLADADGDGHADILTYGKLSAGITFIACDGQGRFRPPLLILPDIPVIDAMPVRLNDDRFPDLVVRDWLNNQLLFFFGMGEMQFSQQRSMRFGQDTVAVILGDFNEDGITDLAVASNREHRLKLYEGDGMLGFSNYQTLDCPLPTRALMLLRSRVSKFPDLLAESDDGDAFTVYDNRGDGSFHNAMTYGARKGFGRFLPADWDGDDRLDVLSVNDKSGLLTTYWNAAQTLHTEGIPGRVICYAVGMRPEGLAVGDLDGDGSPDIIVANNGSASLTLLMNDRQRSSLVRHDIPTLDNPAAPRVYGRSDTSATLLVGHEPAGRVSVVDVSTDELRSEGTLISVSYAIRTAFNPKIILPDAMLQDSVIEFYIYSGERQTSLSYFRQVSGARFLERSLTPLVPSNILAASVDDFNGDGRPDIAYAYRDSETSRYSLAVTFSDSMGQYPGRSRVIVLPDTSIRRCLLFFCDLNGDNISDCVLWSSPSNTLRVALGAGDGRFMEFETILDGISISGVDHLQSVDLDQDGVDDIVAVDDSSGTLFVLRGKGNGHFDQPKKVMVLPRGGSLRFGDFDGNGVVDIVCTDPDEGVAKIYYRPFTQ